MHRYYLQRVATVLTVYGIETSDLRNIRSLTWWVATVLTVYGIETLRNRSRMTTNIRSVATVLTVYGIETEVISVSEFIKRGCNSTYRLRYWNHVPSISIDVHGEGRLQQYLPFTVLKLLLAEQLYNIFPLVATVLTVYGIETLISRMRLSVLFTVATVLTVYGIETFILFSSSSAVKTLQQYLPFTVLKLPVPRLTEQ